MNALKRILIFFVCFVVIGVVAGAAGGALFASANAASYHANDFASGYEMGRAAGREFALQYGGFVWVGSLVISAGIAFRWIGGIIATAFSILIYFAVSKARSSVASQSPPASITQTPSAPTAPAGTGNAQQRAIQAYPALGIANSPLNQEFVRRYRKYQVENRLYFDDPEWPTKLAHESSDAVEKP